MKVFIWRRTEGGALAVAPDLGAARDQLMELRGTLSLPAYLFEDPTIEFGAADDAPLVAVFFQ